MYSISVFLVGEKFAVLYNWEMYYINNVLYTDSLGVTRLTPCYAVYVQKFYPAGMRV